MTTNCQNVMFTGGIPADSVENVFTLLAENIGDRALAWPDGEVTPARSGWIGGVNREILAKAPFSEEIQLEGEHPYPLCKALKIKEGAEPDLRGRLPYAADAIASYKIFKRMKSEGKIPEKVRFQSSIPGAHDVISISFPDSSEWPRLFRAWQEAVQEEYRRMLEVIPAGELCIQIDFCTELVHIGGTWPKMVPWTPVMSKADAMALYTSPDYILGHINGLPKDVRLGFHICCGTSPHYPVQPIEDIRLPVDISNAIQKAAAGRVDYFHLPAMKDSGEAYFAPLADLTTGDALIYLGLECNDGVEAMERRIAAAKKALPEFGVAHYCGYFWNKEIMPELMQTLAKGADSMCSCGYHH